VRYLFAAGALLFALSAHAQELQTCQYIGNTRYCSTTGAPAPAVPQYTLPTMQQPDILGMYIKGREAAAAQRAAQAAQDEAEARAELAREQGKILQQQREAAGRAAQSASAQGGPPPPPPQQATPQQLTPEQQKQLLEWVHADSTEGLKAKSATLEAVMRNSPPDSTTFKDAVNGLAILNAELGKRGALK
jgi:hypothetical protein